MQVPKMTARLPQSNVISRSLYEVDFYAWTQQQAALLRDGRWEEVVPDTSLFRIAEQLMLKLTIDALSLIQW